MNMIKMMTSEQVAEEKTQLKVNVVHSNQLQWPLMFVRISTATISVTERLVSSI